MTDRFEDCLNIAVVLTYARFQLVEFGTDLIMSKSEVPQLHESSDHMDTSFHSSFAVEYVRAPCSVNAYGRVRENFSFARWSQFATTSSFSFFLS